MRRIKSCASAALSPGSKLAIAYSYTTGDFNYYHPAPARNANLEVALDAPVTNLTYPGTVGPDLAVTKVGDLTAPGGTGILATVIATIIAFVVGYAVIVWFLKIITTRSFMPFVIYRLGFAAVIVVLVATGTIAAN